jgi:flagellar basal body-associated protein FliL
VAKEGTESHAESAGAGAAQTAKSPFPIVPILNLLAILGAAGFFYYTKFIYKRPIITEETERERLAEAHSDPTPAMTPGTIQFEPLTINISSTPERTKTADGTSPGKLHYIMISFALEIRDQTQKELIEALRPYIIDKLIVYLGRKHYHELNTVQGRYILNSQIIEMANQLVARRSNLFAKEGLITRVYFTQFLVQ